MADPLFQAGAHPSTSGLPRPEHSIEVSGDMHIERDLTIQLSDGTRIYADVYRPAGLVDVPVILAWSPYGKHLTGPSVYEHMRDENGVGGAGVDPSQLSPYTGFEGPDPVAWVQAGYAVVTVNPRALWWSEGEWASIWGEREARDVADAIEWAGSQHWSSGRVAMTGVSYLATVQWWVAALRPPRLAAINPCEGQNDPYREFIFHGGIPDTGFPPFWQRNRLKFSTSKVEALADMAGLHPLDDGYWASKRPDLANIEVPALVMASWSDQGLHTRGTLAAFEAISSTQKHLVVHGRKKWAFYHDQTTFELQRTFFDTYVKSDAGSAAKVQQWPRVKYEIRTSYGNNVEHTAAGWPLTDTTLQALHLDAQAAAMTAEAPQGESHATYDADIDEQATFDHRFEHDTDIVGPANLRIWLSADQAEDADVFVGLQKIGRDGSPVGFAFANTLSNGPVALGWLRASHRALDLQRSKPDRPFHPHDSLTPLVPGHPVHLEIEVWPSATRFLAGETLRVVVRGSDLYRDGTFSKHGHTVNQGHHTVWTGGPRDSTLVVNVRATAA